MFPIKAIISASLFDVCLAVVLVITVLSTACQQLEQLNLEPAWFCSCIRVLGRTCFQREMCFLAVQGVVLAATFAVSHNVAEAKPVASGSATTSSLLTEYQERDWGVQQVCPAPPPTQPQRQHAAHVAFADS